MGQGLRGQISVRSGSAFPAFQAGTPLSWVGIDTQPGPMPRLGVGVFGENSKSFTHEPLQMCPLWGFRHTPHQGRATLVSVPLNGNKLTTKKFDRRPQLTSHFLFLSDMKDHHGL